MNELSDTGRRRFATGAACAGMQGFATMDGMMLQILHISVTILAAMLVALSFVGCVLPVLPGPLLAYAGLLLLYATASPPSMTVAVIGGLTVILSFLPDYIMPSLGAKAFKCSRLGMAGCFLGSIWGFFAGLALGFFIPFPFGAVATVACLLIGPFVGTFAGEVLAKKKMKEALSGAVGSFAGFLVSTALKAVFCLVIAVLFAWTVFMP